MALLNPYQTEEDELNPDAAPVPLPGATNEPEPTPMAEGPDHAAIAHDTISKAAVEGDPVAMTQGLAHKAIADHDSAAQEPAPEVPMPGQKVMPSLGGIPKAEAPVYGGPSSEVVAP